MVSLTSAAVALAVAASGGEPPVRGCETRAEGPGPAPAVRPGPDVVLGRVAFRGLGRRLTGERAKVPAIVRTGPPVTVRITPLGRTRARLAFHHDHPKGHRAITFAPCTPGTPRFTDGGPVGPRTGFAGGFIIRRKGCARLVARSPGEPTVRRRVALGGPPRRCG